MPNIIVLGTQMGGFGAAYRCHLEGIHARRTMTTGGHTGSLLNGRPERRTGYLEPVLRYIIRYIDLDLSSMALCDSVGRDFSITSRPGKHD
jgi:hypothetical protein